MHYVLHSRIVHVNNLKSIFFLVNILILINIFF